MAAASTFAQHYVECDNCEQNSAQFLCKTCSGHLCEECKVDHERRKLTRTHEITHLKSDKEESLGLLHCSEHKTKKLECFCGPCKKPVCTDCIVLSHNGHNIKTLSTAYKEIRDDLQEKKECIEFHFLPKYQELFDKEVQKDLTLSKQANEIEKQIEAHTQNVVDEVLQISENTKRILRMEEEKGRQEILKSKVGLMNKIKKLQQTKDALSAMLEAKPETSFFKPVNNNLLSEFHIMPEQVDYQIGIFMPEQTIQKIEDNFGTLPKLCVFQKQSGSRVFQKQSSVRSARSGQNAKLWYVMVRRRDGRDNHGQSPRKSISQRKSRFYGPETYLD